MERRDPGSVTRRRPGLALVVTIALVGLYATGIGNRPAGAAWDRTYDVVLYNLPYLAASAACVVAARRVRTERVAWAALAIALTLGALGNALRVLSAGLQGNEPSSTLSHAVTFAAYLVMYVPVVVLIRTRVPRFHPSMWLDGVVAALGSLSAGVAFVLGPYLRTDPGGTPIAAFDLWHRPRRCCSSPWSWPSAASSACAWTGRSCCSAPGWA